MAKLAVIDIGTNSIHMVLAEILPDASYKIVDRFKDMTRLGNGAFATRRLSDEAVARGLDVLKTLVTLARNKGFERIIAVATSAVREAQKRRRLCRYGCRTDGTDGSSDQRRGGSPTYIRRCQTQSSPPGWPDAGGRRRRRVRSARRRKQRRFAARKSLKNWERFAWLINFCQRHRPPIRWCGLLKKRSPTNLPPHWNHLNSNDLIGWWQHPGWPRILARSYIGVTAGDHCLKSIWRR